MKSATSKEMVLHNKAHGQHTGKAATRVFFPGLTMRFKLIAFFVAMISSVAVVMVSLVLLATHTTIEEDYEIIVRNAATSTAATMQNLQERVTTYSDIFSRKGEIAAALAINDVTALENILVNDYKALHANDDTIATLEVTDNRGVVVMRGHNPGRKGDDKSAVPMIRDALQGQSNSGLTVSITTGEMAMDSVVPLRYQGRVVGTIKVGSYLRDNTARYLSELSNTHIALIANNQINASTLNAFSGTQSIPADALAELQKGAIVTDTLTVDGQRYNIAYVPLNDSRGRMAAVVMNLLSRENLEAMKWMAFWRTALIVSALAAVSLACALVIAISMTKPLGQMQRGFIELAEGDGDLTRRFPVYGKDEISMANDAINRFLEMTHHIVKEAMDSSHETATASEELSATSESLSSNIGQQFELVERTGSLVNEVGENLDISEELAVTSTEVLEDGYKMLTSLIRDLGGVNQQIIHDSQAQQEMAKKMQSLNQEANKIEDVLSIISEVADQTNLLALNASIEAARAGDQGRGFAVVANEVRVLAERTQSSLGEIRTIITSITTSINAIHSEVDLVANNILGIAENSQGLMQQAEVTQSKLRNTVDSSSELVRKSTFIAKKTKDLIEIMREMFDLSQENKNAGENITDVSITLAAKSNSQLSMLQRFKM